MPFISKIYQVTPNQKIQQVLLKLGFTHRVLQRLLIKGRVSDRSGEVLYNGDIVTSDEISVVEFCGSSRGLTPLLTFNDFAIFDKPSGVMVHPSSRYTEYSLLDEVKYHFGSEANIVHRIDAETSGLVVVARDRESEIRLKSKFEKKEVDKSYLAAVRGKASKRIIIDTPIARENKTVRIKMVVRDDGKASTTVVEPLKYDVVKNQTLVKATPITGRQHQIRVHLDSIGHPILGDTIYGVEESISHAYLEKRLSSEDRVKYCGAKRLCLQANELAFEYDGLFYRVNSKLS
jgi:23S rRNA pseudouridine1911/1915/1917 synthase